MSLKLRLALFNTVFVLLTLSLGLLAVISQTRRVFLDSLDHDLIFRAQMFTRNPGMRGGGPGGQGGQGGQPGQPGQGGQGGRGGQGGQGGEAGQGGDGGQGGPIGPNGPQIGSRPNGEQGFDGQINTDIGRPIRYKPDGKPFNNRELRVLDPVGLAQHENRHAFLSTVPVEGIPTRVITMPIPDPSGGFNYVQFGHDLADFERLKQTQMTTVLFLIPFSVIVAALVGWLLAGKAVKPINDVAVASEKISGSDMSTRLEVKGDDEIGRLSSAFNGMVDRLQLSFNERQKLLDDLHVALEKQRQFVGDASHELRTPLARIRITTSSALEQVSSPAEMKEALEIADRETVHMSNLVDQLLTLARLDSGHAPALEPIILSEIANEAAGKFPPNKANPVTFALDQNVRINGDRDGLIRAVVNLLENAKRYSPEGPIVVSVRNANGQSILSVKDSGIGIEPQYIGRLTERFFRVDDARNRKMGGTGLGLAIVKSIVESSGGKLVIRSEPGQGTEVQLIFPSIS